MSRGVSSWLSHLGAPDDFVRWAEAMGDDWPRAWAECPRADWLLDLATRTNADRTALVRAACGCARLALPYLEGAAHQAAEQSLETAECWAGRRGPVGPVTAAREALQAYEPSCPDEASRLALKAALAASSVVVTPERAREAALLALAATHHATGDCGVDAALGYVEQKAADAVRTHIPRQLVRQGSA